MLWYFFAGFELVFKSIAFEMQQYFPSLGAASSIILEEGRDIAPACKDLMLSMGEHAPLSIFSALEGRLLLSRFRDSWHKFVGRQQHR